MKLCVDCKFFSEREVKNGRLVSTRDHCHHPLNTFEDPVHGQMKSYDPSWLRRLTIDGVCGMEAKWHQARFAQ